MKNALISLLAATLMGFAAFASDHSFNAVELISLLFATGLVSWTINQYNRGPRVLTTARPIHLPIKKTRNERLPVRASRLAA